MKYPRYEKELVALLQLDRVITVEDFIGVFGKMPMTSVYARIRVLVEDGKLSVVGKGQYLTTPKPPYHAEISEWMKECHAFMINELEGVNSCISERGGNLEVEVAGRDMAKTADVLKKHYEKVMYRKDANLLLERPVGYVLIGRMTSESPLYNEAGMSVASPEKVMVDAICRGEECDALFQRMLEVYPINRNCLHRYAARRGVAAEVDAQLERVNRQRVDMFARVQRYLSQTPIVRAWVFGSFARGEENAESDLDLLVDYDKDAKLSLLTIVRYQLDLEKLIGREVDLVQNGFLKPFAQPSAERDKYLIYERQGE